MNIIYIDGSPRAKDGTSGRMISALVEKLDSHTNACFKAIKDTAADMAEAIISCDALVIAFPLYVDGIPSHLLSKLVELETLLSNAHTKHAKVFVLCNCGFYEAKQTRHAIEMMKIWCEKSGLTWGQGIGMGAGEMSGAAPIGKGPSKNIGIMLQHLAGNIETLSTTDDYFFEPNFPRVLYKAAGNMGFVLESKRNGLRRKDLYRKHRD